MDPTTPATTIASPAAILPIFFQILDDLAFKVN
jgi:hypothetical protein